MLQKRRLSVQKKQRRYYSGKKKQHTLKAQVVVHHPTGQILCTAFATGRVHDFRLFKHSRVPMCSDQLCLGDKGYQGMAKLHAHSCTPARKPPKQALPDIERQHNRQLALAAGYCGTQHSPLEDFSHLIAFLR